MGTSFGHDFSKVRIFSDGQAAQQAEGIDAQAFTLGSDIFFGQDFYDPHGPSGQCLLAHELTHVAQQDRFGRVGEQTNTSISNPFDSAEQEAETSAKLVAAGARVKVCQRPNAAVSRNPVRDSNFTQSEQDLLALQNVNKAAGWLTSDSDVTASDLHGVPANDVDLFRKEQVPGVVERRLDDIYSSTTTEAGLHLASNTGSEVARRTERRLSDLRPDSPLDMKRSTQVKVGPEESPTTFKLGSGRSTDATLRGSEIAEVGRYYQISDRMKGLGVNVGLSESAVMRAFHDFVRFGELPPGHPLNSHPDAANLFRHMQHLDDLETLRMGENIITGPAARQLMGAEHSPMTLDEGLGVAAPKGKQHQGGLLPASRYKAGESSRAISPRIRDYTPENADALLEGGRRQFNTPLDYVINDYGQGRDASGEFTKGGEALSRRTQFAQSELNVMKRWHAA